VYSATTLSKKSTNTNKGDTDMTKRLEAIYNRNNQCYRNFYYFIIEGDDQIHSGFDNEEEARETIDFLNQVYAHNSYKMVSKSYIDKRLDAFMIEIDFKETNHTLFTSMLKSAQETNGNVKKATTPYEDIERTEGKRYFLSFDLLSGYMVDNTGELTGVFSTRKGRGKQIINDAIVNGACHLDCFDGFLPSFYKQFGFKEVNRVANWTAGEPDVVFMERG
jgi:hypothetical protein